MPLSLWLSPPFIYLFVSPRRIKIRESRNRNGETTGFPFISPDLKGLMWQLLKVVQSSKVSEEPAPQVLWWKLKFRGQKTNKELHPAPPGISK